MLRGKNVKIFELPTALYDKVAYRGGTEGIIAEIRTKERTLDSLKLGDRSEEHTSELQSRI